MESQEIYSSKGILIHGPRLLSPHVFHDKRGCFHETWNKNTFNSIIRDDIEFVQDNESFSKIGVLRGLHYQLNPNCQGKLVRVSSGKIYDVIVDLRADSRTFLSWMGVILDDVNKYQIWIPAGFAHGFLTLSNTAVLAYKVTNYWCSESEKTLFWNDKDISINWPFKDLNLKTPILSDKDRNGSLINELALNNYLF